MNRKMPSIFSIVLHLNEKYDPFLMNDYTFKNHVSEMEIKSASSNKYSIEFSANKSLVEIWIFHEWMKWTTINWLLNEIAFFRWFECAWMILKQNLLGSSEWKTTIFFLYIRKSFRECTNTTKTRRSTILHYLYERVE